MIFFGITIFYICMFPFQQTSNNQIVIDSKANTCAHDIQLKIILTINGVLYHLNCNYRM